MQADAIYNQRGKSLEFIEEPYCAGAPVTAWFPFPGCRSSEALRRGRSRCSRSNQYE